MCPSLGDLLEAAGREAGARVHRGGTYICIEGPQFSTKGESQIYRRWGVSVIGMTNMPEAKLAREAELCYATLALATDYDVWHESHAAVTVEAVVANLLKNVATAQVVLRRMIPRVGKPCTAGCGDALASAVITNPKLFPPRTRRNLALLLDNAEKAKTLVTMVAPLLKKSRPDPCPHGCDRALEHALITAPAAAAISTFAPSCRSRRNTPRRSRTGSRRRSRRLKTP